MLVHAIPGNVSYEFAADVRLGLTRAAQKELPSKYLYDNVGSALFEVIRQPRRLSFQVCLSPLS